jgi:hypothetical protein
MCCEPEWIEYAKRIQNMLKKDKYNYCKDTLLGIRNWITKHQHITDKQKGAINRIVRKTKSSHFVDDEYYDCHPGYDATYSY